MSKKTRQIINILLVAVLVVSLSLFGRSVVVNHRTQNRYDNVRSLVTSDNTAGNISDSGDTTSGETLSDGEDNSANKSDNYIEELLSIDLTSLIEISPEVKGWIYIPDTIIDYPIMQHSDNDYYLKHTWDGTQNKVGSIFFDCQNETDLSDFNTIVYGHNMNNGSMFGTLENFLSESFIEEHPSIYIVNENGVYKYDIFAVHRTNISTITFGMKIYTDPMREEFISFALDYSDIETEIEPTTEDSFLTLSTCSYGSRYRIVVQAILDEETSYIRD